MSDTTTADTVVELPADMRDALRQTANRALMVRFINADLLNRASLDVRRSIVFYDVDGLFEYATSELPDDDVLRRLREVSAVRFWSRGI